MKRKYLETVNSILETILEDDEVFNAIVNGLVEDGSRYPEKDLTRLHEEILERLTEF